METQNKSPEVRFEGFTVEWEEKVLGDYGKVSMNKRIFKSQTSNEGEIPFYKIGTFGKQPDAFIKRELFEEYKKLYPYPNVGDILISASGSIGRTVVYKGEEEYFQDSNIVWLEHEGSLDNSFLKQYYSIIKWYGLEGSTIQRLYNKNILETNVFIPQLPEQKKIGNLFSNLDKLIKNHQTQLKKLKNLKKAMLTKMFPQNGASVPEIRFKGFDGEWERKSLDDICDTYSGGTPSVGYREYYNGKIPFIRSGEINSNKTQLFISEKGLKESSAKLVDRDCILYALYGATSGEVGISKLSGAINQAILAIQPYEGYNNIFISEWLKREKKNIITTYLQGGQGNLSGNIIKSLILDIPNQTEQEKIGDYFKNLDDLIENHKEQLNKLNNIKKACLNKLFVA
ncbi:restriction endonuclease subunit S [Xanthomarina sp.]|uniref:restriction endonuclease subunit S n=1 Tax=Xanthomarina sp. TaxID=1931211 RepID=UPI002B5CF149|nr:restriction endonuclease subunit S [Xanthomarina sp.]HLV40230.1 restriction endonuclease subunit S [Xanthomarina sp.]